MNCRWGRTIMNAPALRIKRLSSLALKACHAFKCSQSSFPQQHVKAAEGSGVSTREKLASEFVKSSIFAVASNKLLARGESGLVERDRVGVSVDGSCSCMYNVRTTDDSGQ